MAKDEKQRKSKLCSRLCFSTILIIVLITILAAILIAFMCCNDEIPSTNSSYNISSSHLTDKWNENYTQSENITVLLEKDDPFVGTYELESSDNFDAYMKELGVGYLTRKVALRTKSKYIITRNGNVYTLKTVSTIKSSEFSFVFGEMFEENSLDGAKVKSKITLSGNTWIQKQFGEKEAILIREFTGDIITLTCTINGVTAVRIYKRVVDSNEQQT